MLNHRSKRFLIEDEDIEKVSIPTLRFEDIIRKYSIKEIEKLLIDVEGFEYEILNDINFDDVKINKVLFEYKHFDGTFTIGNKLDEILEKFRKHNYTTSKIDKENILAIKK